MSTDTKASAGAMRAAAEILVGPNRCPICGWPLADRVENGCVLGNCSDRSESTRLEHHQKRAHFNLAVEIIETHVAELVEALEQISERDPCPSEGDHCDYVADPRGCMGCVARRALRRFKEGL